jgi:hypothetical protein
VIEYTTGMAHLKTVKINLEVFEEEIDGANFIPFKQYSVCVHAEVQHEHQLG